MPHITTSTAKQPENQTPWNPNILKTNIVKSNQSEIQTPETTKWIDYYIA